MKIIRKKELERLHDEIQRLNLKVSQMQETIDNLNHGYDKAIEHILDLEADKNGCLLVANSKMSHKSIELFLKDLFNRVVKALENKIEVEIDCFTFHYYWNELKTEDDKIVAKSLESGVRIIFDKDQYKPTKVGNEKE